MTTLPITTLIGNAAAVVSGVYGAVTAHAKLRRCSRQTLYKHAQIVEQALRPPTAQPIAPVPSPPTAPITPLATRILHADQRRFALEAFASGLSTRQTEHLLRVLLGDDAPDHATIGRWVADATTKAKPLLEVIDRAVVPLVQTIAGDEIFLATAPRSWASSLTA